MEGKDLIYFFLTFYPLFTALWSNFFLTSLRKHGIFFLIIVSSKFIVVVFHN